MYTKDDLLRLKPKHATFVGIDSDGCVFDTMEIKQKKCFHGLIVSHWRLEPIAKYVRETAEFANLYSKWRGTNRFLAILKMFELLEKRPEAVRSGVVLPKFPELRKFAASGAALGNPELEKAVKDTGSAELASLLQWSRDVNACIARTVKRVPPFPWARRSIEKVAASSDALCVSQTPTEALLREWQEHGLDGYVSAIAGQELGTKSEHIALATKGRYAGDRILMIGDAPGDREAAEANGAHFYPIHPRAEDECWERFHREAYDRFLNGAYGGAYERDLTAEFMALLPEEPPWSRSGGGRSREA